MLKIFLKGIIVIDSILLTFVVFIMIYRISVGKTPFISLEQLINYFENRNIYQYFNEMKNNIIDQMKDVKQTAYNITSINDLNDFFRAFKNFFKLIFEVCYTPWYLLIEVIKYVINIIKEIFYFFEYITIATGEYIPVKDRTPEINVLFL